MQYADSRKEERHVKKDRFCTYSHYPHEQAQRPRIHMLIGYARVSTGEQKCDLQLDALHKIGCVRVYADESSGRLQRRPELDRMLRSLRPGDTVVTWKLDRLGRSLPHLISLVTGFERRGVGFRTLSEAIDTQTASGKLLFHMMGALAEFERNLISERTRAGLAAARLRGAVLGRPRKSVDGRTAALLAQGELPQIDLQSAAKRLKVSVSTLRRRVADSSI